MKSQKASATVTKGMSCKNTRFIKRGLTWDEVQRVEKATKADRERWLALMAKPLNKWVHHG
jgi:hypothetical protein